MNFRKLLAIVLFFVSCSQSYSQLSGYYTIGGSGADYQILSDALSDLYTAVKTGYLYPSSQDRYESYHKENNSDTLNFVLVSDSEESLLRFLSLSLPL